MRVPAIALAATLLLGAGCRYAPKIESGMLMCSAAGECPEGFSCAAGLCNKNDVGPGDGGDPSSKFLGRWVFGRPTPQMIDCTLTGPQTDGNLADDYIELVPGQTADLSTFYYCPWSLNVAANGASATIEPGTTCSKPDPDMPGTSYTWRGERFTITPTSATKATLDASIPFDVLLNNTFVESCTMSITSTMTKGTP